MEENFIILKRVPLKCENREILLDITTKRQLVDSLVRGEIKYCKVSSEKYTRFLNEVDGNAFIRGHVKHINIYNLYSKRF